MEGNHPVGDRLASDGLQLHLMKDIYASIICVSDLLQYPIIYEGFSTIWGGLYDCDALVYAYLSLTNPCFFRLSQTDTQKI